MLFFVQLVHAAYIGFVLTSPAWVLYGGLSRARWLPGLRAAHLATLLFVALQYTFGWACPLTQLENALAGRPPDTELLAPLAAHSTLVAAVVVVYGIVSVAAHAVAQRPLEPA